MPPTVADPTVSNAALVLIKSSVSNKTPTVALLSIVAPFAKAISPPVTVKLPPTVVAPTVVKSPEITTNGTVIKALVSATISNCPFTEECKYISVSLN